jgi:hypothetical protein
VWRPELASSPAHVLCIGRHRVDRYAWAARGALPLQQRVALPADGDSREAACAALPEALRTAFAACTGPVVVLLESAWLPAMWVATGGVLWQRAQALALLQQRFRQVHGEGESWEVRTDFRAGDRFALGYGLPGPVRRTVLDAAQVACVRVASLASAFAWSFERLHAQKVRRSGTSGWLWMEQDRALLATFDNRRLVGWNPAVQTAGGPRSLNDLLRSEAARLGLPGDAGDALHMGAWEAIALPPSWRGHAHRHLLAAEGAGP